MKLYYLRSIESDCVRCGATEFPLIDGFFHDVRCYGWRTAFVNIMLRVQAALGVIELA